MYLERLNIFSDANPYYQYGGKFYNCIYNYKLPNCTEYCLLRIFSATSAVSPYQLFSGRSPTGYPEAKKWFNDTILPKGYELRDGCVAVFDGNSGHVCFVERKLDDTHAIITESQYDENKNLRNYKYWNRRTVELIVGKATLSGVGKLIGFIYPDIDDKRTERSNKPQVEIIEEFVNVRVKPEGELVSEGCYCPMGIYDVLSTKEVNGFVWYQLDTKAWVREGSWLIYHNDDSEVARLKKENTQLREDIEKIYEIIKGWL